jgi:ATP-dependent exoDNAse (exonuclease V) beta subunit
VLPPSLMALFPGALSAADGEPFTWQGQSRLHEIVVARPAEAPADPATPASASHEDGVRVDDGTSGDAVVAIDVATPEVRPTVAWPRVAVATRVLSDSAAPRREGPVAVDLRLAGRLVHRLFQTGTSLQAEDEALDARIERLLRAEERADVADLAALCAQVRGMFTRCVADETLVAALASGTAAFEAPFSLVDRAAGVIVRGVIDCLVTRPDGSLIVIELKTGRPRPEDRAQLETYVLAARALNPGVDATGLLVYA